MKKNTITKLLLILVMLLLVFSLFACDGDKGGNGGKTTDTSKKTLATPEVTVSNAGLASWSKPDGAYSFRITVYNEDGTEEKTEEVTGKTYQLLEGESIIVVALPKKDKADKINESAPSPKQFCPTSVAKQLVNLLNDVKGIVETWNGATNQLSADIAIGGFFESGAKDEQGNKKQNSFALSAQANASVNDPEFMIGFKLNEKDYVSLGYKDNAIYVREPMNLFNILKNADGSKPATPAAEALKIDVSAFSAYIPKIMGPVMKLIGDDVTDLNLESMIDDVSGLLTGTLGGVAEIFKFAEEDGKKIISATVGTLSMGIGLAQNLPMISPYFDKVDEYIGYFYKVTDALKLDRIQLDGEDLSFEVIKKKLANKEIEENKLLNIEASYKGSNISALNLVIDLGALGLEGVEYRFGLTIDLNKFSNTETVNINTSGFTAKDLEINLGGILGEKNLSADVKAVLRLSDAFKAAGNKWATLFINNTAAGYIDATGAYADFAPAFAVLGENYTGTTKFKANYLSDGANVVSKFINEITAADYANPIEKAVDELIADMKEKKENKDKKDSGNSGNSGQSGEQSTEPKDESFDLIGFVTDIANGFGAASDKVNYVCETLYPFLEMIDKEATGFKPAQGSVTQATVINYIFNRELGDSESCIADYALFYKDAQGVAATTFEQLGKNIKAQHEAGKAALTAATNSDDTTAGVQLLLAGDNNDLLDYVANFVKVPSIDEVTGEPNFENLVAINDADNLIDWLNWIFPTTNEYRGMVEDILGIELVDIINGGVYCEAINLGGFNGAIRVAANKDTADNDSYAYLSAGFGMKDSVADTMPAIETEVKFNDVDGEGDYIIATTADALLTALRNYGKE